MPLGFLGRPFGLAFLSGIACLLCPGISRAEPATGETIAPAMPTASAVVRIPERWLAQLVSRSFRRETDVDRFLHGAHVTGKANTSGNVTLVLGESEGRAALFVVARGAVESRTVAQNGVANIYSTTVTQFQAFKPIVIRGKGLRTYSCQFRTDTRSRTNGVEPFARGLPGEAIRLANEIGSEAVRAETNAIADADARRDIGASLDAAVEPLVKRLNERWAKRTSKSPWLQAALSSGHVSFSSTTDFLQIELAGRQRDDSGLRPTSLPAGRADASLEICWDLCGVCPQFASVCRIAWSSGAKAAVADVFSDAAAAVQQLLPCASLFPRTSLSGTWLVIRCGDENLPPLVAGLARNHSKDQQPPRPADQAPDLTRARFVR